jgi:hypothetical protein
VSNGAYPVVDSSGKWHIVFENFTASGGATGLPTSFGNSCVDPTTASCVLNHQILSATCTGAGATACDTTTVAKISDVVDVPGALRLPGQNYENPDNSAFFTANSYPSLPPAL